MSIKFISERDGKILTFADVPIGQFFMCEERAFWQKSTFETATCIARRNGRLSGEALVEFDGGEPVKKIYDIERVEF